MFSEWRKFVASTSGRHFVLKFEAGGGGYRIFVTDFEQLWLEEVATEADLAQILKERAGSFEIGASDFVSILQEMIKSLPNSFVSFEDDKLVLSHKLGFIKFNWTFQVQLCNERLPKFLFNDMIIPLLRQSNEGSALIEDADIQVLNNLPKASDAVNTATTATNTTIAMNATTAMNTATPAPVPITVHQPVAASEPVVRQAEVIQTTTAVKEEPIDPATVEQTKRKELEEKLAASSAAKKKKRLL